LPEVKEVFVFVQSIAKRRRSEIGKLRKNISREFWGDMVHRPLGGSSHPGYNLLRSLFSIFPA
jgi:hypothetical protein